MTEKLQVAVDSLADRLLVMIAFLADRLNERTTAAGIALGLGSLCGWSLDVVASAGLVIGLGSGVILYLLPEKVMVAMHQAATQRKIDLGES
ncbi:MAG: hypothetical protein GC191_09315 [Azospirillum sp.]|nr:hypothetical protein [Azospirillum sp.]